MALGISRQGADSFDRGANTGFIRSEIQRNSVFHSGQGKSGKLAMVRGK